MSIPYEGREPFIFVSYAHKDALRVVPLIRLMQEEGYRVWYDEGIDPGRTYTKVLSGHIADCHMLLAFYSENYLQSDFCMNEMNMAAAKRKPGLIVKLQDIQPDDEVLLLYGRSQFITCVEHTDRETALNMISRCDHVAACRDAEGSAAVLASASVESSADAHNMADPVDCVVENGVLKSYKGKAAVVRLPEGITEIGENAFADNQTLAWLFLPQSLCRIGKESFAGCSHLQRLFVPDAVTVIGINAFKNCTALRTVQLPENLTELHNGAFFNCRSLQKIWLPDGLKELRGGTFAGCSALKAVYLPAGMKVAEKAFTNCSQELRILRRI